MNQDAPGIFSLPSSHFLNATHEAIDLFIELRKEIMQEDWNSSLAGSMKCLGVAAVGLREFELQLESRIRNDIFSRQEKLFRKLIEVNTRTIQAIYHSNFNLLVKSRREANHNYFEELDNDGLVQFKNEAVKSIQAIENGIEEKLKSLYCSFLLDRDIRVAAGEVTNYATSIFSVLTGINVDLFHLFEFLIAKNKNSLAEGVGLQLANSSDLIRESLASYASAEIIRFEAIKSVPGGSIDELSKGISQVPYTTNLPDGKNTEIAHLSEEDASKYIEVRGIAGSVEEGSGKMFSTLTKLTDPSSKQETQIAARFKNLEKYGVGNETFLVAHGQYKLESDLHSVPGIEVDSLNIQELSERSWKIRFLRIGEDFFERWPGGLNLKIAISPHDKAKGQYGANELIYRTLHP